MTERDDEKTPPTDINTGGSAYIGGDITVSGGDSVWGDQVHIVGDGNVIGDHSRATVLKQSTTGIKTDEFLQLLEELQRELSTVDLDPDVAEAIEVDLQAAEEQARRPKPNRKLLLLKMRSVVELLEMSDDVSSVRESVLMLAQEALAKGRQLSA